MLKVPSILVTNLLRSKPVVVLANSLSDQAKDIFGLACLQPLRLAGYCNSITFHAGSQHSVSSVHNSFEHQASNIHSGGLKL